MIIDSSALISILLKEKDADLCLSKVSEALSVSLSVVTFTETSMVLLSRGGRAKLEVLSRYLEQLEA